MSNKCKHYKAPAGKGGLSISVGDQNFEKVLKKFKKMVMNDGVLTEYRKRQQHIRKGEVKRIKKQDAIRRRKKQEEQLRKLES